MVPYVTGDISAPDHATRTYRDDEECVRIVFILVKLVDECGALGDLLRRVRHQVADDLFGAHMRLAIRHKRGQRGMGILKSGASARLRGRKEGSRRHSSGLTRGR